MTKYILAALAALLLTATPAQAAVYNVTTFGDPALTQTACPPVRGLQCSLRAALTLAGGNQDATNTINLPAGPYIVSTQLGDLDVRYGTSIIGAGADVTSVDGGGAVRVFHVQSGGGSRMVNVTIKNGTTLSTQDPYGGNVVMEHGAGLELNHVRVTGGVALQGGGIATGGGGTGTGLVIRNSLIDNNEARGADSGLGGGVLVRSSDNQQSALIQDSTITRNRARLGAGIVVTGSGSTNTLGLERVTLADNAATSSFGGIAVAPGVANVQGTIIARNTPTNCAGTITNQGGNVESGTDCNFTNGRQNTTAGLASTLSMDGGFTPVLTIPINSPARDFAGSCKGTDQRDVTRPQGTACDAGAYETLLTPPTTAIVSSTPPFTFVSEESSSTFECSIDDAPFSPCSPPFNPSAAPGPHKLAVRATDRRGNVGDPSSVNFTVAQPLPQVTPTPTPSPSATPSPTPVPTPLVNKVVVVKETKGTVKVRLPGTKTFIDLDATRGIPTGSEVDTRKGTVELTSVPTNGGTPQTARFYDGLFKVTQANGITTLTLTEALAPCPKRGSAAAAAKKPKTRKLWGDGKGSFRTNGKYSAATVRGTKWLVQDSCAGTLTRVAQGVVNVRDKVKRKTIVVRAPKKYLARPKR